VLKQHFQNELVEQGYPEEMTIDYSLSYSQGDGVAFYGNLYVDDIQALMKRLFHTKPAQTDAVCRVKNLMAQKDIENMLFVLSEYCHFELSIERNNHGYRYSNWGCMSISDDVDFQRALADEDTCLGTAIDGINQNMLLCWQDHWERFISMLEDDIKRLSRKLEKDGYALIEASPYEDVVVCEKMTENYLVRVSELAERDFNMDDWEGPERDYVIDSILEKNKRLLGLRVEVLSREGEMVLGEATRRVLTVASNDKTYVGYKRELLRSAIQEARENPCFPA